jgi:hypothetical protein
MRVELKPHPDTPSAAVQSIVVDALRDGDALALTYRAIGRMEDLAVPAAAFCERMDDLWKHTCFEAFVRGDDARYCEFNFSPSTQWAAYVFDDYRAGRRDFEMSALAIHARGGDDWFEVKAVVTPGAAGLWRVALSAVIEETNGAKSYWALRHPAGKPDFHHADGFALLLTN